MTRTPEQWLQEFNAALAAENATEAVELFEAEGFWRDFVALTWNLRTAEGREQILDLLTATIPATHPRNFSLAEEPTVTGDDAEAWLNFETDAGRGWAHLRLRNGVAYTLLTTLQELKGFEERKGPRRDQGVVHEIVQERQTWLEKRQDREARLGYQEQPYVVIVGGGQGGIGLAARLGRLNVPTIVVDKHPKPGDAWRNRYKSLHLHDPVWYDHMPYLPFPDDWPVFPAKDKVADWLLHYADIMELNYWGSTECTSATWDAETETWVVEVNRAGEPVRLRPTHLVFALGVSGYPQIPEFPGQDVFAGDQHHSSAHPGGETYRGKKAVVIGSNNSAHDICADLWAHGAEVTMVQRSSTHIAPSAALMKLALGSLYSEEALANGVTTEKADMLFASLPYRILPEAQIPIYELMKEENQEFYQALEDAGFKLDFGEDGSGLFVKYLRRGSGYYIDVGASQLVIDGRVKLATGQVDHLTKESVVLADDTELPADLVVYATGYGSMNQWLADLVSQDVADRVGKCWGMGSETTRDPGPWEGELRNMWKPTNVDNLWIHGGNLHQSRHYSKYLSLQLKARMEGLETPVYKLQESHHPS
ncbi:flavin-containing monooxygenase [Kocuria sp.]|uniref:flavin-containing monooxygenase n=1 Tax=Kocuria sp. TaxID=1871328 RepID=UPI0026DEBE4E|nr:NAD(P)/FAD-dependent oxidoreductase [Kocuria sp.]MDO5618875.1 NAD(P)/FAD-dependent oxidoreductase [Kocuria sp.]